MSDADWDPPLGFWAKRRRARHERYAQDERDSQARKDKASYGSKKPHGYGWEGPATDSEGKMKG